MQPEKYISRRNRQRGMSPFVTGCLATSLPYIYFLFLKDARIGTRLKAVTHGRPLVTVIQTLPTCLITAKKAVLYVRDGLRHRAGCCYL